MRPIGLPQPEHHMRSSVAIPLLRSLKSSDEGEDDGWRDICDELAVCLRRNTEER
jgi:hypothetical protein